MALNSAEVVSRPFPSLARFTEGGTSHYTVCDPEELRSRDEQVSSNGGSSTSPPEVFLTACTALAALGGGVGLAAAPGGGALSPIVFFAIGFVAGAVAGLFVLAVCCLLFNAVKQYRERGKRRVIRVEAHHERAWALCEAGERLTRTEAWSRRPVDQQQRSRTSCGEPSPAAWPPRSSRGTWSGRSSTNHW